MSLSFLIVAFTPVRTVADYIPLIIDPAPKVIVVPKSTSQTKQTIVYAKKEKLIKQDFRQFQLMVEEEFANDPVMIAIARYESSFDPKVKNPTSSAKGLFQITNGTWADNGCTGSVLDPEDNIACAKKIKKARGTQPWDASKHNWGKVPIAEVAINVSQ